MDTFVTLYSRLLNRCPAVGQQLGQQLVNDAWRTLQSRREWSWRRRSGTFAPPNLYTTGTVSTNAGTGNPNVLTGIGTTWTQDMIGRQIRVGGLLYPYYDIVGWNSATEILIGQPWAGADVVSQPYQILQIYYPVPEDFGYWYSITSIKDAYRLWYTVTQNELAVLDPQRTNQGQTYAVVFRDYATILGGVIGPVIPITSPTDPAPISTSNTGYTYIADASYIVQVVAGGISGVATFNWMRAGQTAFQPTQTTANTAQDLQDGVQIYWPDGVSYVTGDLFVINATANQSQTGPRYELWPGPTFQGYLYPYIYIAKEYDLTVAQPQLPPFIANRGEVLLEMALASCARYPGADAEHPNVYFNLALATMHETKAMQMIYDLERNDEEVGLTNVMYETYPMAPAPWATGAWQQSHAPFYLG